MKNQKFSELFRLYVSIYKSVRKILKQDNQHQKLSAVNQNYSANQIVLVEQRVPSKIFGLYTVHGNVTSKSP